MAVVDVIVNNCKALWRIPLVGQRLPWIFLGISIVGSIVKDTHLLPDTYFSNSRNLLNTYFVKVSWGWTLMLLTPFILLTSYNKEWTYALRRLSSLVVATAIWYTVTETFFYIEDATGTSCLMPESQVKGQVPYNEINTSSRCRKAGGQWDGFDISGHSFILSYSALVIAEEMAPMANVEMEVNSNTVLDLIYISLNSIVIIWVFMFCCTSVYFHAFSHKFFGTVFGILGWYITYRVWYLKPMSPGLPQQANKKGRQPS
ncbi:fat storage-inducing transmembrane protein 2 [Esox lucius]|uniref:Fat storage-inducing transmembrane protein 2 n=1 Tax=Esox lucius TaxID=8010 RepID=A0AAY5K762_ESOLU|nr:fat storage-inducing transmembrane protein 2 [Esox lucius]